MAAYPRSVIIEEQGLRDGIQSESKLVPTSLKLQIVDELIAAGLKRIQAAAFVLPKLVPQMADAEEMCEGLPRVPEVVFSGLVLNDKGIQRAVDAGLTCIAASISASDAHSLKNVKKPLADARRDMAAMFRSGKDAGLHLRGGVQCAFGCRFQGEVAADLVLEIVEEQLALGVDEIALADSTGMANPAAIQEIGGRVVELAGGRPVWLHLHDTEGKGMANALAALLVGIRHFDTAFGGMGGCPFIRGASGNIATEDFAVMLHQMGIATGIDVPRLAAVSRRLEDFFEKSFSGKMHRLAARDDITLLF